jgi:hypothetical protein
MNFRKRRKGKRVLFKNPSFPDKFPSLANEMILARSHDLVL